jgi:flagellar motor switch protein FliG
MSPAQENTSKGIYINGKKQIIDMLQFMNEGERKKLLDSIRIKNPTMAKELSEKSFSFNDLVKLEERVLGRVFQDISPAIIGLALHLASVELQRKVLSVIDRSAAEQAYEIMTSSLGDKKNHCFRAQQKIIDEVILLSRRKIITI